MKKSMLLLLAAFLFINVDAQVKLGLTAGLHSGNLLSTNQISSKTVYLLHGGLVVDFRIPASQFHIQGQALYTSFGYKNSNISAIDKNENFIGDIGDEKIGYVQIPVLVLYQFGVPDVKFKIGAGPFFAYETNATTKITGGDTFRNTIFPIYTTGRASPVNGFKAYAGIEVSKFFGGIDYEQSFNNIYENSDNNTKWKTNAIGISVGFFLK